MSINVQNLIKGIPDWNEIVSSNDQILANAIDENQLKIGDLSTSTTTDKSSVVAITNEINTQLSDRVRKTMYANIDINAITDHGFFSYCQGCTNTPNGSDGYLIDIYGKTGDANYDKQLFTTWNKNELYIRTKNAGIWTSWSKIATLDTVTATLTPINGWTLSSGGSFYAVRVGNTVSIFITGTLTGTAYTTFASLPTSIKETSTWLYLANDVQARAQDLFAQNGVTTISNRVLTFVVN